MKFSFLDNIKASFSQKKIRKSLEIFLYEQDEIHGKLIKELAISELRFIEKSVGNNKEPNKEDIYLYVLKNFEHLDDKVLIMLHNIAQEAIPGFSVLAILKNIALTLFFVTPALICLSIHIFDLSYIISKSQYISAFLLLLILIILSGVEFICNLIKE